MTAKILTMPDCGLEFRTIQDDADGMVVAMSMQVEADIGSFEFQTNLSADELKGLRAWLAARIVDLEVKP